MYDFAGWPDCTDCAIFLTDSNFCTDFSHFVRKLYGKKSDTSQNSYNFPKIVFFFKSGFEKEDGVKYRGNRDMKSLEKYIQEQLGNEAPEEPAKVRSISALVDEQP